MLAIVVFGTGSSAVSFLENIGSNVHVTAFLDNDPAKQGSEWKGIPVLSPESVNELAYDYLVIASQFVVPIREQLIGYGVDPECILPMYPLLLTQSLLDKYRNTLTRLYGNRTAGGSKPRIQLLTLNRSGCNARALYDYAPDDIRERYDLELVTEADESDGAVDCIVTTHRSRTLTSGINVELWHGFPIKAMGRMNAASEDRASGENWMEASAIASYSPLYTTLMNACFPTTADQYTVTGLPRNDRLFRSDGSRLLRDMLPQPLTYRKAALYMPTFRMYSSRGYMEGTRAWDHIFDFPQFDDARFTAFLKQQDMILLLKLHPFEEAEWLRRMKPSSRIQLITEQMLRDRDLDMYDLLNASDILITDYSSVYFDYLLLDRPVIFTPTDLAQYRESRGMLLEPYEWWAAGGMAVSQADLERELQAALIDPMRDAERRRVIRSMVHNYQDGRSTDRVWRLIDRLIRSEGGYSHEGEDQRHHPGV